MSLYGTLKEGAQRRFSPTLTREIEVSWDFFFVIFMSETREEVDEAVKRCLIVIEMQYRTSSNALCGWWAPYIVRWTLLNNFPDSTQSQLNGNETSSYR